MRRLMMPVVRALVARGVRAQAAPTTDTVPLTLDQAVQRALEQSVDMRLARASVLEANGQVRQAFSGALPQVTGSLVYTRQFASIYQGIGGSGSLPKLFSNNPLRAPHPRDLPPHATQPPPSRGKGGARVAAAKAFPPAAP